MAPQQKKARTSTWGETFPEDFEEQEDSEIFFMRCIYLVFVYIMCKRKLLPSYLFKKRSIEGIIKTYVMNSHDALGVRVANKFRALGEAIKLRFLNSFMLVIGEDENDLDSATEVFTWKMNYTDSEPSASFLDGNGNKVASVEYKGPEYVKHNTRRLLFLVKELCTTVLKPLPKKVNAGFRISYTKEAPEDYQAEGFYPCSELYHMDSRAENIKASNIDLTTPFHRGILSVESVYLPPDNELEIESDLVFKEINLPTESESVPTTDCGDTLKLDIFESQRLSAFIESHTATSVVDSQTMSERGDSSLLACQGDNMSTNTTLLIHPNFNESIGDCGSKYLNSSKNNNENGNRIGQVMSLSSFTPENSPTYSRI